MSRLHRLGPSSGLPKGAGRAVPNDGLLVGADGSLHPHATPLTGVPAALPVEGRQSGDPVIFVNGIDEAFTRFPAHLQQVANGLRQPVVGLYNASEGRALDLAEVVLDRLGLHGKQAARSLYELAMGHLEQGRPLRMLAHSHGADVASRALFAAKQRLLDQGLTVREAEKRMAPLLLETFAGAATEYPRGPTYVHYVNLMDLVPMAFGRNLKSQLLKDPNSTTRYFATANPLKAHGTDVYFKAYVPLKDGWDG